MLTERRMLLLSDLLTVMKTQNNRRLICKTALTEEDFKVAERRLCPIQTLMNSVLSALTQRPDRTAIVTSHMTESQQRESCSPADTDDPSEEPFTLHPGAPPLDSKQTPGR